MGSLNMSIHHIYREGNALADYLANIAIDHQHQKTIQIIGFQDLPTQGKRLLNRD